MSELKFSKECIKALNKVFVNKEDTKYKMVLTSFGHSIKKGLCPKILNNINKVMSKEEYNKLYIEMDYSGKLSIKLEEIK